MALAVHSPQSNHHFTCYGKRMYHLLIGLGLLLILASKSLQIVNEQQQQLIELIKFDEIVNTSSKRPKEAFSLSLEEEQNIRSNQWFHGVLDVLRPLKDHCTVSPLLRDIEDGISKGRNDLTATWLAPFQRRTMNTTVTSMRSTISRTQQFEFPCPLDQVQVSHGTLLSPNSPQSGWTPLQEELVKDMDQINTTQVWYRCSNDTRTKLFSWGINPHVASQQITTTRKFHSEMHYKKGHRGPPSIYIFLLDSTSRSSFHRSFPSVVESLGQNKEVDVFEMFRYSSVAWGTSPNTGIFFQGCGLYPGHDLAHNETCSPTNVPLHIWYAAAGYALLGNYTYWPEAPFHYGEILSAPVELRSRPVSAGHRTQLDAYIDIALEQSAFYRKHAPELPTYFAAHLDDNHAGENDGFSGQSASIQRLLDGIDFTQRNTMVLFVSDHGQYTGDRSTTPLGAVESSNPVLVAIMSRGGLQEAHKKQWRENQQSLATHWDMHATLKSLPLQYGTGWPQIEQYCNLKGKFGAASCEPYAFNSSRYLSRRKLGDRSCSLLSWQKNLILTSLPQNRKCEDAKAEDQFCFCTMINMAESEPWNDKRKHVAIHQAVGELNKWTGNGTLECVRLKEEDFAISRTLVYNSGKLAGSHVFKLDSKTSKLSFLVEVNQTMQVVYFRNKYGTYAPKIIRQDLFSKEPCLVTYDDGRMPIFRSQTPVGPDVMLRWCSCRVSES